SHSILMFTRFFRYSMLYVVPFYFFYLSGYYRDLHSFPTRRSSDLPGDRGAGIPGRRADSLRGDHSGGRGRARRLERPAPPPREAPRPDAVADVESLRLASAEAALFTMRSIDRLFERSSRSLARRTSRRSLLGTLGRLLTGAALLPLLPLDRSGRARAGEAAPGPDSPE